MTSAIGRPTSRGAFTLVELLLVVAILGIAMLISVPTFVRSARSARLRAAVQTVSMASRLARNKAVLQSKDMAVIFYIERNEIELVSLETPSGVSDREMFLEGRSDRMVSDLLGGEADGEGAEAPLPAIAAEMVRPLPPEVRIVEVEAADGGLEDEGAYWVNYYRNGMSDGFTVRLIDADERTAAVRVDALSGRVTVAYGS
jgi:prepilin-type N-terminal cleavage/methylation domain-containing protein